MKNTTAPQKIIPYHLFFLVLYPILSLYARHPGSVELKTVFKIILLQLLFTATLFIFLSRRGGEPQKPALQATFFVFYFSSTGYARLSLESIHAPAITHIMVVLVGIIGFAILLHPYIWERYLPTSRLIHITSYLNMLAIFANIYPVYQISNMLIRSYDDETPPWREIIQNNIPHQDLTGSTKPDIYYIILDGYGREDALLDVFGYDNNNFIKALEARGFYVAGKSRSNYIRTVLSLSSSLNISYINFTEEKAGWDSLNYRPLYDLINHGYVRTTLEKEGYKTVSFNTEFGYARWDDADELMNPYKTNLSDFERTYLNTTALGALYDPEFGFTQKLRNVLPLPSYEGKRRLINFTLQQLPVAAKINGPKFVFVHILAPHPPFVFDKNGQPTFINRSYAIEDGEGYKGTPEEYKQGYIGQMQYINQGILTAIDEILSAPGQKPVIIIQGDHGSGLHLDPTSIENSCMFERTSILNAYFMPPGNNRSNFLYPEITPVNSFRVIFNMYFGTDYPLLDDRTYYSPWVNPYGFVEITDNIEKSCQTNE